MYNLSISRKAAYSLSAVIAFLFAVSLFAPSTASALDFYVQPRINTGLMYYDFTQDAQFVLDDQGRPESGLSETDVSDLMPVVGDGATLFVGKYFLDIYAQRHSPVMTMARLRISWLVDL